MKVLYFGTYDPKYARDAILIRGLIENGVEVLECNDRSKSVLKYIKLFFKHLKYLGKYDVMMVGFPGQESMFLARFITWKPIVLNIFTSHYMGYVVDRKKYKEGTLRAKYFRFLDKWSCKLADVVILDTQAHIDYFVNEFRLPVSKFKKVWLGARTDLFKPIQTDSNNKNDFTVLFWGSFIPLQGVEYIIKAAKKLENEGITFNLAGKGQTFQSAQNLIKELDVNNINLLGRISDDELLEQIKKTDICLSTFGPGIKSESTIQNKIFETLAVGKPLITARTKAVLELFNDREHMLLCEKAHSIDLADKILELKNNPELMSKISSNGHTYFRNNLMEKILGSQLVNIINKEILS